MLPLREDAERRGDVFVCAAPDLPGQWVARDAVTGVVSQGDSRPHALAMLAEALALHAGEALPTGEAAPGARTVDAVAREVVAWAGTPAGLLAMMAHRGKQDLVALATAVLERGARLAGPGATREPPALGPEAIPALGCDWQKIEGILSRATPLVAEGDAADLCPELEALIMAGGIPCPPAPGWIWRAEGGSARCLPWTDPSEEGAALRARFEGMLAARGPGWFPVLVKTAERVVLTAMEKSLFRPSEESSPGRTFQQLAALLVQAGHAAAAGLDQVILAEAVPYEDVPGAYQVLVTSAAPDALSADQRERLEAAPRTASATRILITLQRPGGQPVLMRAVSAFRTTDGGVVEGGMTLSPGIAARFLAGGYPCPAPPGRLWVSQGGGGKPACVPWSAVPMLAERFRALAEELLAARGPGWFPVFLDGRGGGEFAVLDRTLFLSASEDPRVVAAELAGILALAGHADAVPPGQVIVCDAALVSEGARTVRVGYDPPEAVSPRAQALLVDTAPFLAKGRAPGVLQVQVDEKSAIVCALVIGTEPTDTEEG